MDAIRKVPTTKSSEQWQSIAKHSLVQASFARYWNIYTNVQFTHNIIGDI